jgi:glycosyltransferase involved in cell wall biosynthesis
MGTFVNQLRIAHVQPQSLDLFGHADADFGTNARYFLPNMAAAQVQLGDLPTVHLLSSSAASTFSVDGVEVVFHRCVQPPTWVGSHRRFGRQLSISMVNAVGRANTVVVHFHGCRSLHLMYAAVAWRCQQEGMALVAQDHGHRPVWPIETAAQRYALGRTKILLPANRESLEALAAQGIDRSAMEIMPNGVDRRVFYPAPTLPSAPTGPFRLLVVSRLSEDKDPLTMVEAACQLVRRGHPVAVTIVGEGPLKDEVIGRLKAGSVFVKYIGLVPQAALGEYYRAADALVHTSLREGFNQATLEAMACGLPIVATNIPGIRDGVAGAGILVAVRDPRAVADALESLVRDPDLRHRFRRLGIEQSRQFDWGEIAKRLHRLYERARRQTDHEAQERAADSVRQ